jgi:hypothetical protein
MLIFPAWGAAFPGAARRRRAGRRTLALDFHQLLVLEEDRHARALLLHSVRLVAEVVVPAIRVERVGQQRRAEDALHLGLRHARLQPVDEVLRDVIALLDVDLVHAAGGREREQQESDETHGRCRRGGDRGL